MSDEDDAEYRRRIEAVLEKNGFGWVVAQAEVQIAEGKPSPKQVSEREIFQVTEDADFVVKRPRARRSSLITSEPYSGPEQLEVLLQAIEAALVQRATLETAVLDQIGAIESIRFERESRTETVEATYLGKPHEVEAGRKMIAGEIERETIAALTRLRGQDRVRT